MTLEELGREKHIAEEQIARALDKFYEHTHRRISAIEISAWEVPGQYTNRVFATSAHCVIKL